MADTEVEGEEEEEATSEDPGHRLHPTALTSTGKPTASVLLVLARFVSQCLRAGAAPLPMMLRALHRDEVGYRYQITFDRSILYLIFVQADSS